MKRPSMRCRWSCGSSGMLRLPGPMRLRERPAPCFGFSMIRGLLILTGSGLARCGRGPMGGSARWCRRARGAGWERASALPGITITQGSAEIRVYPPVPVDEWPPDLASLQVAGTELEDPEPPPAVPEGTPVLWVNPGLPMTAGKAMAQVGHAAQLAWMRLGAKDRSDWRDRDFNLAVRPAPAERWPALVTSGLPVVQDGGFTEVAPGSCTVVADLPALRLPAR